MIPVHPITVGSAKLQDWLIRKMKNNLENNIRGQISLYPTHENRKIEKKSTKKTSADQLRSWKSGKNEGWHE